VTSRSGFGAGPIADALRGRAALTSARPAPAERAARLTGIGAALRSARERRGLSYAEAESATHIPRHHLQALEDERFDALSARVYVRGFLRSYGQYLGLDVAELVALLPPDRPLEEERLLPLSRLGRPRGPREAARARRHPIERDAPPLTDATLASAEPSLAESEWEWNAPSPRLAFPSAADAAPRQPRVDPLGRLGWPAGAGDRQVVAARESRERPLYEPDELPDAAIASGTTAFTRERPLAARKAGRRSVVAPLAEALPEDVLPLFSRQALPGAAAVVLALLLFYVLVMALGGGDVNPAVVASTAVGGAPAIATTAPAAPSVSRGQMLDLQGRDLQSAVGALQQIGITPVVIEQTTGSAAGGQVLGQTPAPGASLQSDTPVMLVVGQP
jgi:hypothetical protein